VSGFGSEPFGDFPFGDTDWAMTVLWNELPEEKKQEDLDSGGYYYKFVTCLMPSFSELRTLIYGAYGSIADPLTARADLLNYLAQKFGIVLDLAEPEYFQRTRIAIAGRWRLIKGMRESFEILCAVHGFDASITELWWTGSHYSTDPPTASGEIIGYIP